MQNFDCIALPQNITSDSDQLMRHVERIDLLIQHYYYQRTNKAWSGDILLSATEIVQRSQYPQGIPAWLERENQLPPLVTKRLDLLPNEPLWQLTERFDLTEFEVDVLLLGLLPHLNSRYQTLFESIQGYKQSFPTIELAMQLFCTSRLDQLAAQTSFLPQAPLYSSLLLQRDEGFFSARGSWGKTPLLTCPEVWHFLLGNRYQTPQVERCCQWLSTLDESDLSHTEQAVAEALRTAVFKTPSPAVVMLRQATSKQTTRVLAAFGYSVFLLELSQLPENNDEALQLCHQIIRNAQLHHAGLIFPSPEKLKQTRPALFELIAKLLVQAKAPLICLVDKHAPLVRFPDVAQIVLDTAVLTPSERADALSQLVDEDANVDALALSRRFSFTLDELTTIRQEAAFYRQQREPKSSITHQDWHQALCYRAYQNFGNLAQRIEPRRHLDDLIISPELHRQLAEIRAAIRYREALLEQGFQHKVQYGTGISALFYGPSGTGKTMAAEVLAHAMQVDLIKIDLSSVVNKYIGETEKNLSRIFDLAEADAGVLFFDEADALLGKRSQVKDAQDRHANIEVSYLLQRLENYPGLVILATNHRNHIDDAFIRRLTFITRFSYPDAVLREKIWLAIWPDGVQVDADVNFSDLAKRIDMTGANIRNIALLACWLANEEGSETIMARHIELASARELAKVGRLKF